MASVNHDLGRGLAALPDSQLRLIERAIAKDHFLTAALHPNAVSMRGWRVGVGDVVKNDLLSSLRQSGGKQHVDAAVANHAVVEIGQPRVRPHLQIFSEALNFEIAEGDSLGAVDAAELNPDGLGGIARTGKSEIAQAVAHAMTRAIVERDGGPTRPGVDQIDDISRY